METPFGGEEFEYEDHTGEKRTVRINDDELYRALRQLQTFENYETGERAESMAVVCSRSEWVETLLKLGCEPAEFWNSGQSSGNELYTRIIDNYQEGHIDAVMPVMNGSRSEDRKLQHIQEACDQYDIIYLDNPQEELVGQGSSKTASDMDGIIDFLEETRKNQFDY